jgi:Zn-dependent alcohol dehydrogenase
MGTMANVAVLPADTSKLRIEEIELPDPNPHQVIVRQFASGICHSQLHEIHGPRKNPIILGHESTGVVTLTGSDVTHVKEGDIVVVTWVPRNAATESRPAEGVALPVSDGIAETKSVFTWADVTIADAQYVVKVDPGIDKDVSCVVGCAVMTGAGAVVNTVDVQAGKSVVIFGAGGVGLCAIAAAKVAGANPIIAVDLDEQKLRFAMKFGATHTVNAKIEDPVKAVHGLTTINDARTYMGKPVSGADYAFDCIGVDATIKQVLSACRKGAFGAQQGGSAVLVGLPNGNAEFNPMDILVSEKTLRGSFCGSCVPDDDIPRFLQWHADGNLDLNALVTKRYRLDEINSAVADLESGNIFGRAIIEF